MILGLGSDLTDIRRIEATLETFGDRFVQRCFTATEQRKAEGREKRVDTYAKRFAAKEACAKALGTGMRLGVFWKDMGVVNLPTGRPTMKLTGGAAARLAALIPPGFYPSIHVSLTDEHPYAQAFVIIEALPEAPEDAARRLAEGPVNV